MKISNNYNQYSPSFGNVVATKTAIQYLNESLTPKTIKKVNQIIADQEGKKPDILLRVGTYITTFLNNHFESSYLQADVGNRTFHDKGFRSTFGVIKAAAKYADSFEGEAKVNLTPKI